MLYYESESNVISAGLGQTRQACSLRVSEDKEEGKY